jgi:hypothetical protein
MTSGSSSAGTRWFVLLAEDPVLLCPVVEARFAVDDLDALRAILSEDARDDVDIGRLYHLDDEEVSAIEKQFGVRLEAGDLPVQLVPWHSIRDVPYLVHTGYELPLMLEGRKPFAKFSDGYPCEWLDTILDHFEPFVIEGRIVKRIIKEPFAAPRRARNGVMFHGICRAYFALPGQEWRIDAHIHLLEGGLKWNETLERLEGMLLGYEPWQNDWHIEHRMKKRPANKS